MIGTQVRRAALVGSFALLVAACGSSSATTAPAVSSAAGGGTPAPAASQAPAASTGGGAAASVAASVAPAASVGNVSGAATALSNLTSYKVTVTTTGGSDAGGATWVVVRKPSPATSFTSTFGGHTIRLITIGTNVWIDEGTGTFIKNAIPASAAEAMTSAFDPGTFLTQANTHNELQALQQLGVESKNGVQAVHLHGDHSTPVPAGEPSIPPGATVDLWVSVDGGYLVALEGVGLSGATGPSSVKLEVTNINDSSLSVTPPS